MRKLTFVLLTGLSIIGLFSCKDCQPVNQPGNQLIVEFYRLDSLLASGAKIKLDTLFERVSGVGNSGILYNASSQKASAFSLPLSSLSASSSFLFQTSSTQLDTISFQYLLKVVSEGPDCGFYEAFSEIQLSNSTFDSVQVIKTNIDLGDVLHVEIFE